MAKLEHLVIRLRSSLWLKPWNDICWKEVITYYLFLLKVRYEDRPWGLELNFLGVKAPYWPSALEEVEEVRTT